jgi:hypothetical protein
VARAGWRRPAGPLALLRGLTAGCIDAADTSGGITLNGGAVTHTSISIKSLVEHAHLTHTVARGDGSAAGGDPPVFHVPIGLDYTIPGELDRTDGRWGDRGHVLLQLRRRYHGWRRSWAQIGLGKPGLSLASPKQILYETKGQTYDPGYPQNPHSSW